MYEVIETVVVNPALHTKVKMTEVQNILKKDNRIFYLKDRWLDEKEYEDFAEYKTAVEKFFTEKGYTVKKVTKLFLIVVEKDKVELQISINAASWKVSGRYIG